MSNSGLGLDFLGTQGWSATIVPGKRIERPQTIQNNIPTALLPLQRGEKPPTGKLADEHRRGRALAWPPEAQVPPLGEASNGSGRIPLSALFEMLCQGEKEWGKLTDQQVSWKPDGVTAVSLNAAKLIAQEVDAAAKPGHHIGLVVPDALGVGGQQAILSAVRGANLVLVPRSIAAVIGYCRASEENLPRGHITVVDTSFGTWSLAKIPVDLREGPKGKDWNVPVSDNRLRRNKLAPTGWGMLRKALRASLPQTLAAGWAAEALAGKAKLTAGSTEVFLRLQEPAYPWHSPLAGESSLSRSLATIEQANEVLSCDSPYKRNLGLMVIGPLANTRFDGTSLTDLIKLRLRMDLMEAPEHLIASGAAWAAAGAANDWPTWLEMMEPLELHYVGADEIGNQANLWKKVLPKKLIDAGKEYSNETPITGIKLQARSNRVRMCMRRPDDVAKDPWIYRLVSTKPGKVHTEDIPLQVNVRARPGQGFAVVTVSSREAGLFESVLDWENMLEAEAPKPPPQGYIEKAVTLKAAPELWLNCRDDLMKLRKWLEDDEKADDILEACRSVVRRLNKALSSSNYQKGYGHCFAIDEFTLFTPMGRDACPPGSQAAEGITLISRNTTAMVKWIQWNPHDRQAINWVKKVASWWYLGCPQRFVDEAIEDFSSGSVAVEEVSLEIAGRCLDSDNQFIDFFEAFTRKMPESKAPNNWMKALRNLIKLNEDCLKNIDAATAELMFEQCLERLRWADNNGKPVITYNSLEALFFLLKYRRTDRSFIETDSNLHEEANQLARAIAYATSKPKTEALADKFVTFLNWDGDSDGLGEFLQGDED